MFLKDIENTKNILILVEYIFGRYLLVKLLSPATVSLVTEKRNRILSISCAWSLFCLLRR